jgi:hypothetical protein
LLRPKKKGEIKMNAQTQDLKDLVLTKEQLSSAKVSFSLKQDKDDKNPVRCEVTLDLSKHTAEELLERVAADVVIDLQRRLRSGKVKLEDVNGKTWEVPSPGTRTRNTDPVKKITDLMQKLGLTQEQLAELVAQCGTEK